MLLTSVFCLFLLPRFDFVQFCRIRKKHANGDNPRLLGLDGLESQSLTAGDVPPPRPAWEVE